MSWKVIRELSDECLRRSDSDGSLIHWNMPSMFDVHSAPLLVKGAYTVSGTG